jgi:hypothetical protein
MPTLQSHLQDLAHSFAAQVLGAIRSASLEELASSNGSIVGNGRSVRAAKAIGPAAMPAAKATRAARSSGRLARRSAEDIHAALGKVLTLLKTHKSGLRAEEIRGAVGMQSKEMPRVLKEGIATKKLTSKGQKRATTYYAK